MTGADASAGPRFGILSFGVGPFAALEREWLWAEEIGFGRAWLTDTFALPRLSEFEAWTLLSALAHATSRIRIGTLITTVVARHPALLANAALTVDHISGGRLEIGIGAGDEPKDNDLFGLERWSAPERFERLVETVHLLDKFLRGESVQSTGPHYKVTQGKLMPTFRIPRPPIVVAAEGPRAMRLAAAVADGWCTMGTPLAMGDATVNDDGTPNATRARIERLERSCQEAGRDASTIRRILLVGRTPVSPFSSLDVFDEFVGRYSEVGITEFAFYWPPPGKVRERESPGAEERAPLERIAAARFGALDRCLGRGASQLRTAVASRF